VGIAGVVGVLVALLAMGAGFEEILKQTGSDDSVIVLHSGSDSEATSTLDNETVAIISQAPQVLRDAGGRPVASAEQIVVASLPTRSTGLEASIAMRGVGEAAWTLSRPVKILEGRKFTPGLRELMVGSSTREEFVGLHVGATVSFDGESWPIVGVFDSGDAHNSEIWGDSQVIGSSYRRGGTVNSLILRLTDASAFEALKAGIERDPRLMVTVQTTREYYSRQSESIAEVVGIVGTTIGAIMALGAIFGALNTTYAAVADRAREIATLRAIGFHSGPVILSVLLETMLLALLGGAVGAGLTWMIFDGFTASTVGANSSQVVFAFDVSRELLASGLKWALVIGLIGGLLPALRAARMPIVAGLREL
jgi:putative ABC transport system permease protein